MERWREFKEMLLTTGGCLWSLLLLTICLLFWGALIVIAGLLAYALIVPALRLAGIPV